MESPNKKKSKFGVKSTVGGELGGSYKTASPYNIKTMNMTNGLSPLMQAAVGGEKQTIPGQNITKTEDGFTYSPGEGMGPVPVQDPDNVLEIDGDGYVVDNDYVVEEGEGGLVVRGVSGDEAAPGMPVEQGPMGGVGETPMEMHSPNKIYSKPKGKRTEY
tara:strand:- start:123 stop:602 length:480 start_codon:yes stop_codon:yes gene_type:complete